MKVGDLVRLKPPVIESAFGRIGIIVDWHVIYDKFGDAVDRFAVVNWGESSEPENEYPDLLDVVK